MKTKMIKWLKGHKEEFMAGLMLMNSHPFICIDPKRIIQRETNDKMEQFINELAIDELKRIVKGRDWYYLAEWQGARQKVKEELFL